MRPTGCTIQLGIEVCTVPSERYNHGSVMHDDGTLYVYGGFSQRCTDYCDDIWFFDIYLKVGCSVCTCTAYMCNCFYKYGMCICICICYVHTWYEYSMCIVCSC